AGPFGGASGGDGSLRQPHAASPGSSGGGSSPSVTWSSSLANFVQPVSAAARSAPRANVCTITIRLSARQNEPKQRAPAPVRPHPRRLSSPASSIESTSRKKLAAAPTSSAPETAAAAMPQRSA